MSINFLFGIILLFVAIIIVIFYGIPVIVPLWIKHLQKKASVATNTFYDSFILVNAKKMILVCSGLSFVLAILGFFIFHNLIGFFAGGLLGVMLPSMIANFSKGTRRNKFVKQLNDVLTIASSSLRGGLSLIQTFEAISEDMDKPSSDEFSLLIREVRMGVSLEEALRRLAKRMPSDEIDLIVSAVLVSRETGGDIIKTFSNLITTMRDKAEVKEMITTLTLQAKIQGFVMFILPFVFIRVVLSTNPKHFDVFFKTDIGKMLMMAAVILEMISVFLIYQFSKIET